ncbi:alanine dehydrogenase [Candidatus Woesearchaeota archaeon]|nr:alanine dehydrogenase [Candidatus Woesearchaeota archaeon]
MIIGVPKEIKQGENRVGMTPEGGRKLRENGHKVIVEAGAGLGSGFSDQEYMKAGCILVTEKEVWEKSDMVVKVKEPLHSEFEHLREGLMLFTYLHLAAEEKVAKVLLQKKVTGIAYETIELDDGCKPLLKPMSEVAGRMAVQVGMHFLERTHKGSGKLIAGVSGVPAGTVTILGSGVAGTNAARIAHGIGAKTIIIGIKENELKNAESMFPGIKTLKSNTENIEKSVQESDLVIGSVAITGASAPKLVTREMIKKMRPGSVMVDISIDQGGCFETSRPTSHSNPVYEEEGVIHYCVTNMPGAVPYTSTLALTNATLPYIIELANNGLVRASGNSALKKGINTHNGQLTNIAVSNALGIPHTDLKLEAVAKTHPIKFK